MKCPSRLKLKWYFYWNCIPRYSTSLPIGYFYCEMRSLDLHFLFYTKRLEAAVMRTKRSDRIFSCIKSASIILTPNRKHVKIVSHNTSSMYCMILYFKQLGAPKIELHPPKTWNLWIQKLVYSEFKKNRPSMHSTIQIRFNLLVIEFFEMVSWMLTICWM